MVMLAATEWLQVIGLGAVLGAAGQGIRTITTVKKLNDVASATDTSLGSLIEGSRMFVALAIGAIAGVLAAIGSINSREDLLHIGPEHLLALISAGYAGADFIEGFMQRVQPDPGAPKGAPAIGSGGAQLAITDGAEG